MMTQPTTHPLAQDYLVRLALESRVLPQDQAHELIADITEHIHSGLGEDATEIDVRNLLDRLGTPAEVVAAAVPAAGQAVAPPPQPSVGRTPPAGPDQPGAHETGAVVALLGAELFLPIAFFLTGASGLAIAFGIPIVLVAWIAGLLLVILSGVWTGREKLRGLLALGTGVPLLLVGPLGSLMTARLFTGVFDSAPVGFGGPASGVWHSEAPIIDPYRPPWVVALLGIASLVYLGYQVLTARALLRSRGTAGEGGQAR